MTRRTADCLRGLGALAALAALLLVPPLALVHFVGWPFPTRIPSFEEVSAAGRSGLDDTVVVKTLAVLAWLFWMQLALAALTEVTAVARGQMPRRTLALPMVQVGIARLVATTALIMTGFSTPRPEPAPSARLIAAVAPPPPMVVVSPRSPTATPEPAARSGGEESPPTAPLYGVRKGDSWWRIAERLLGDGQRWKELRSLNAGRSMPDGTVIDASTETIRPGWQFVIPPGTEVPHPPAFPPATGSEVVVERGDNLWVIAARQVRGANGSIPTEAEIRHYWVDLIDANRDRLADADNPSRIYTGQRIRLPGDPPDLEVPVSVQPQAPASDFRPAAHPEHPLPSAPEQDPPPAVLSQQASESATEEPASKSVPPVPDDLPPHDEDVEREDSELAPAGALGVAGTLLAAGVGGAVIRRRRRRQVQLPRGAQPPNPPKDLDPLRAEIAASADLDQVRRLHLAMRDVGTALADRRSEARPRLVQVGEAIEVLLSQPVVPAPPGWKPEASGSAWVLAGEPIGQDDDGPAPNPALVTLGRPDGETELYLDLEAEGIVSLVGDPSDVADVARSWVLELATSQLSSGASVLLVGGGPILPPEESDRVRIAETWDEIAGDALAWVEQSTALLAANRWTNPPAGRVKGRRADDLAPLVVFMQNRPDDERFENLCRAVVERQVAVTAVIVGDSVDGATRIEVNAGALHIPSMGLTCPAQAVTPATAEEVDVLLADASHLPDQLEVISPPTPRRPITLRLDDDEYQDPPYDILVRCLGDICVVGGTKKLKPKQTAVFTYIALHSPVASERVEDALWVAETSSRKKRLANTVSETRTALGASHLPAAMDGRYSVGSRVATDIELFDRRLAYAAQQQEGRALETLRGALDLVQGPVFTYRNADRGSYVWVDVENWHSNWELRVVNAAEDLAQRWLDFGELDGAVWAATRGLTASPIEPRLTKLLMKAYVQQGDRKAAEQVFQSYQAALEALDLDEVEPEVIQFYEEVRRGRHKATAS